MNQFVWDLLRAQSTDPETRKLQALLYRYMQNRSVPYGSARGDPAAFAKRFSHQKNQSLGKKQDSPLWEYFAKNEDMCNKELDGD